MNKILPFLTLILLFSASCKTTSIPTGTTSSNAAFASVGKEPEMLDGSTYKLTEVSTDKTYGYTPKNPINSGGGPSGERKYLNALTGPNGEPVKYTRQGSCCPFKTPNGVMDNTGMLDKYEVTYDGLKEPVILYLNMYDLGEMKAPVNFGFKK